MRTIATGLEAYCVDHGTYPMRSFGPPTNEGYIMLSTPIAYISSMPMDVFGTAGDINGETGQQNSETPPPYHLGGGHREGPNLWPKSLWLVASFGPDRDDDTHAVILFPKTPRAGPYDPTNGSISHGDLYRLGNADHLRNFGSDANPDFN